MEISFWKHLLIGRDKDHLGIKIGTDRGVVVENGSCWARHNENTVTVVVVFGHAQMKYSGNGIDVHSPCRGIDTYHIIA